jgi:hypothetical protein
MSILTVNRRKEKNCKCSLDWRKSIYWLMFNRFVYLFILSVISYFLFISKIKFFCLQIIIKKIHWKYFNIDIFVELCFRYRLQLICAWMIATPIGHLQVTFIDIKLSFELNWLKLWYNQKFLFLNICVIMVMNNYISKKI